MKCLRCDGKGWYLDHSPAHYAVGYDPEVDCEKYNCPVQVQCEVCSGKGKGAI